MLSPPQHIGHHFHMDWFCMGLQLQGNQSTDHQIISSVWILWIKTYGRICAYQFGMYLQSNHWDTHRQTQTHRRNTDLHSHKGLGYMDLDDRSNMVN